MVLKIYRRIEDWHGAPDEGRRGKDGPVYVAPAANARHTAHALLDAARLRGIPVFDSPNGAMMEGDGGAAINDLRVRDGRRLSIFRSYAYRRMHQPNLTVMTDTLVSKLVFEASTVVGVEVIHRCPWWTPS